MIHVEPYNSFGEGKAQSIGSQYALKGVQPPEEERVAEWVNRIQAKCPCSGGQKRMRAAVSGESVKLSLSFPLSRSPRGQERPAAGESKNYKKRTAFLLLPGKAVLL